MTTPHYLVPFFPEQEAVAERLKLKHPDWFTEYAQLRQVTSETYYWLNWLTWLEETGRAIWIEETKKQLVREHNIAAPNLSNIPLGLLYEAITKGEGPTFFEALERTDRWHEAAFVHAHGEAWNASGELDIRAVYAEARRKDQAERQRRAHY